ncbi:uncharacterized protein PHALS_07903 [Plasmopara halstedii]|uniref:Uncharacterized protein n=1 Tax=Plasmopara halstedii TaxID=4781 RepID=A0A0P1B864_PLAHL|nr:uncharacterized protein PHALS_07903 [Plasmopara halstedii]CEG50178.1 hypothetical protein PHALS_07903 [Plasmopara halstedii]|eukprot:XP_024586547.1 hypothetical protein PHALS_07903 [Plasmopara halstedii]
MGRCFPLHFEFDFFATKHSEYAVVNVGFYRHSKHLRAKDHDSHLRGTTAELKVTEDTTAVKEKLPQQEAGPHRGEVAELSHLFALKDPRDRPRSIKMGLSKAEVKALEFLNGFYGPGNKPFNRGHLNSEAVDFLDSILFENHGAGSGAHVSSINKDNISQELPLHHICTQSIEMEELY